ncbi:MAG: formylglycine-generating enzyme family protein [Anaerolineales bacterium]|nr:formylglycine-generating enzyme family protein [Anaerolineales bacterium]
MATASNNTVQFEYVGQQQQLDMPGWSHLPAAPDAVPVWRLRVGSSATGMVAAISKQAQLVVQWQSQVEAAVQLLPHITIPDQPVATGNLPATAVVDLLHYVMQLLAQPLQIETVVDEHLVAQTMVSWHGKQTTIWNKTAVFDPDPAAAWAARHEQFVALVVQFALVLIQRELNSATTIQRLQIAGMEPLAAWALVRQATTVHPLAKPKPTVALPHIIRGASPLGMRWCWVPGGSFNMGSDDYDNERPIHVVAVDDFLLAQYPVTNTQYRLFIEAGGYRHKIWWPDNSWKMVQQERWTEPQFWGDKRWNDAQQPVVGVSWYEAIAFCRWAAAATGEQIRLPTEAEWEKAARGSDGRTFPWGNTEPTGRLCHVNQARGSGSTRPVGQFSPQGDSPFGCADMAGNVYDWCLSTYEPYPYRVEDGRNDRNRIKDRVVRGGSWDNNRNNARCASRNRVVPHFRSVNVGFRCASTSF